MSEENWVCEVSEELQRKKDKIRDSRFQKLPTFDWLAQSDVWDVDDFGIFEVSFKDGARKDFCRNINKIQFTTGDWVIVNTGNGYDVGRISLSGDLVKMQMKKRKVKDNNDLNTILRPANDWEIDKMYESRSLEKNALIKSRAITASLNIDMKIGDVEYQGDGRKVTFFYTSDGRVDFRELVKVFAREFKVKIEMRQIGIRQESSKIGGIASCGRELCCSTWHTDFTSVTTEMVRYQNLSVNQSKLTGLCGRLKCCLNYELDTYLEALDNFPSKADVLRLQGGNAYLVKLDIFKGIMYYSVKQEMERNKIFAVSKDRVVEILEMNKNGQNPLEIGAMQFINEDTGDDLDFEDVTGQIELPEEKKRKKQRGRRNNRNENRRKTDSKNKNQRNSNRNRKSDVVNRRGKDDKKSTAKETGKVKPNDNKSLDSSSNRNKKRKSNWKKNPNYKARRKSTDNRKKGNPNRDTDKKE